MKKAEESTQKAESDPSDKNIAAAKSDIEKLPEDKRQPFAERIAALEKTKQEEKEKRQREEKAQKEAEEQKRKAEEAAAAAREQQRQQAQPAPQSVNPQQPAQNSNLPLKAICKDGTVQYQDTPSLPNYRGMCSKHGGIKERLGRVP